VSPAEVSSDARSPGPRPSSAPPSWSAAASTAVRIGEKTGAIAAEKRVGCRGIPKVRNQPAKLTATPTATATYHRRHETTATD
jgi:hypothetical protein